VTKNIDNEIRQFVTKWGSAQLRSGLDVLFVGDIIARCIREFEIKAEELFPHALKHSEDETNKQITAIRQRVQSCCDRLFVEQCIAILVPDLHQEIVAEIKGEIETELNRIPVAEIGVFSFADLLARMEMVAESRFRERLTQVHQGILESAAFNKLSGAVRPEVSQKVKEVESVQKRAYQAHIDAEEKKRREALEAKYQQDLRKLGEEEAEKRRKLEEEKAALLRQQAEEQTRHRLQLEEQKARLDAQLACQSRLFSAIEVALKKKEQNDRVVIQKMREDHQATQRRMSEQFQEERSRHDARHRDLQQQIQQLQSRPLPSWSPPYQQTSYSSSTYTRREPPPHRHKHHHCEVY
jgi:hypothetical protein